MGFPERAWMCLACRMALTQAQCPAGHRDVVAVTDTEALVRETWGPPRLRQQLLEAGTAGSAGGGAWSLLDCGSAVDLDLEALAIVVVVIAAVWLAARAVARFVRARTRRRMVRGATRSLPRIARTGQTGTILPGATAPVPTLGDAVAFAAEYEFGGRRTLHDAATIGFEVLLDTGERVIVPAGSCVVALDTAREVGLPPLVHRDAGSFDPFIHQRVRGVALRPGDRVEVCSPLDPVPDDRAGYRDIGQVRTPRGVIRLRPC